MPACSGAKPGTPERPRLRCLSFSLAYTRCHRPALTGRSSNHRPGVLDCPVKPGKMTALGSAKSLNALPRRFQTIADQELVGLFGRHWMAEHVALRVFAAELVEVHRIGFAFRALLDHVHAEIMGEPHDGAQDHRARPLGIHAYEGLV